MHLDWSALGRVFLVTDVVVGGALVPALILVHNAVQDQARLLTPHHRTWHISF
jgi:hypothetical protein